MFSAYMTQLYGTDIRIGYSESMDEFFAWAKRQSRALGGLQ